MCVCTHSNKSELFTVVTTPLQWTLQIDFQPIITSICCRLLRVVFLNKMTLKRTMEKRERQHEVEYEITQLEISSSSSGGGTPIWNTTPVCTIRWFTTTTRCVPTKCNLIIHRTQLTHPAINIPKRSARARYSSVFCYNRLCFKANMKATAKTTETTETWPDLTDHAHLWADLLPQGEHLPFVNGNYNFTGIACTQQGNDQSNNWMMIS